MSRIPTKFVKAKFKLRATNQEGRLTAIKSGYRPNHVFEYVEGQILSTYIGEIQFDRDEWIQPGEERVVTVQFVFVPEIEKYLVAGRKWWIHEGSKVVGEAEIVEV